MKNDLITLIKELCSYLKEQLNIQSPIKVNLKEDKENSQDVLGKTGHFNPEDMSITVFSTNRHPKDVARSVAHECVHLKQHEEGKFKDINVTGEDYFLKDKYLQEIEREAYEKGNMLFRSWEEQKKRSSQNTMDESRNLKLNKALMEKFHLNKKNEEELENNNTKPNSDYDPEQLKKGIKVEKEHTDNEEIAEKIAKDHLDEIPDYYDRLSKMEKNAIE